MQTIQRLVTVTPQGEVMQREKRLHTKKRGKTYHKFVNTTPKPNATKNRSGELVGPLPPPGAGVGDEDERGEAMVGGRC